MFKSNKAFKEGQRDGLPIGLGYFAVSFSLGIAARNIGLDVFQCFLVSLLNNASAGEYSGFTMIASAATLLETAVMMLIANGRYLLMSTALSQKLDPNTPLLDRLLIGFDITDELFALAVNRPHYLEPAYYYGSMTSTIPFWAIGTAVGCLAGNIMPEALVSAFSVALFGMFLAVIIPPTKKDRTILVLVIVSFAASYLLNIIPWLSNVSGGTKTIILTLTIATIAAVVKPLGGDYES